MRRKRYESQSRAARAARDRTRVEVILPLELIEWCDAEVKRTGKNRSEVIVAAIRMYSGKILGM